MYPDHTIPLKTCSKCGRELPRTPEYFPLRKSSIDGLRGKCRDCYNAGKRALIALDREHYRAKGREWIANNPEKKREMSARDYEAHKAKRQEKHHAWKASNKEYISEYNKQFRRDHPELMKARRHAEHVKYPHVTRIQGIRRRARLRGAEGHHTFDDIRAQYKSQNGRCWWCGKSVGDTYHVDHLVPLARGGSNWPNNLVIACPMCNSSKSAKLPHEFNGRLL
jgi:5-methylcytosine-specific restriction endonuclease McrA